MNCWDTFSPLYKRPAMVQHNTKKVKWNLINQQQQQNREIAIQSKPNEYE